METSIVETPTAQLSKGVLWTSRLLSAIPVLLVLLGSVMKLMKPASVIQASAQAGLPERLIVPVGLIELTCVIVYLVPSTSVLGAILLTGLLGGATVTTLRIGDPTYPLPILLGMMAWGGLYLRDRRLRALIPLRTPVKSWVR
jgi:DoxX-like family